MNHIITDILEIIHTNQTLIDIEISVETYFTEVLSNFFPKALERMDLELIQAYKDQGYEIDRIEKWTVQFTHGPVELKRRRIIT